MSKQNMFVGLNAIHLFNFCLNMVFISKLKIFSLSKLFLALTFSSRIDSYSYFSPPDDEAGLEFCEAQKYMQAGVHDCPSGVTFGNQTPPTCICVRGIYRAFMDNCEVTDGFAKDVCMLPYEKLPGHTEKYPKVNRVRAIQFLAEPDWDLTHAVVEGPGNKWVLLTEGDLTTPDQITLKADWFYMINGKAFISKHKGSNKPTSICIEPTDDPLGGTKVCKVTKASNTMLWMGSEATLTVRRPHQCWIENGDMNKLTPEPCIRPLMPRNDECVASCVREGRVKPPTWPNCPPAVQRVIWDNEYLERQLKQYIIQSQVKGKPAMEAGEPQRTMELFQLMVQITAQFCPETFVKPEWVNWMAELFYLLHKGNRYRFPEIIFEEDQKLTKKILEDCLAKGYKVRLTNFVDGMVKDRRCQRNDIGPAVGYCKEGDDNCLKPVLMDPMNEKMEHRIREKQYVPEVAWTIVDATQAICFREFNASYRMFHILQQAVEKLFTYDIKNLWYHPPSNHIERLKTMIAGKGAEERIGNLEICTASAYHILNSESAGKFGPHVTFLQRLKRPPLANHFRRRRAVSDKPQESNGYDPPNPNGNVGKLTEVFCRFAQPENCKGGKNN